MAKLPEYKRLTAEDYPEQVGWIGKLLVPVNRFMLAVYQAFNKQLTINENLQGQVKTNLAVTGGSFPVKFRYSLFDRLGATAPQPAAVIVGKVVENKSNPAVITSAVTLDWSYDSGTITINNMTGLTAGQAYLVNLLVLSN